MFALYPWGIGSRLATIWGITYVKVRSEEEFTVSDGVYIGSSIVGTAFILKPNWSNAVLNFGVRAIVTNPVVQAVTAITVTGAVVSVAIDPEDGLDNYLGFITGGMLGEREPNYFSGDPNNSGYFNIPKNFDTIVKPKAVKQSARTTSWISRGINWIQNLNDESSEFDDTH